MFHKESVEDVQAQLDKLEAEITQHPLASAPVREAQAIVEERGDTDKELLGKELAARNLPSLEELGKIQLAGTASWWALNRKKNKLLKKKEKLQG